jgi:hypothetical protein
MGPNHSFLGFVKNIRGTHPKDELKSTSICYPPQACVKIKRYLPKMVGEKFGKEMYLNLYSVEESLALCLGWKIHLSPDHTPIRLQIGL